MLPVYEKRRAVVKAINKFWAVALMNHTMVAVHAQHNSDQAALGYLEDLWIVRDPAESRCFTLEFVSVGPFCWTPATSGASADGVGACSSSRRTRTSRTRC